jgi:3',5'-cyclic AMP phosphodiesterase CpdA
MSNDEQVIFNLLQISDLHFGDNLGGDAPDRLNARLPPLLARYKHMNGVLGHHYKALASLHDFYKELWKQTPRCALVVTGDLTANGAESQFDLAHGYLGSKSPQSAFGLGLSYDAWASTSIAGNHDHWPGNNRVLGKPTAGLKKYLQDYPKVGPRIELRRELSLRFVFLNSDADVFPWGYDRLFARGHFVSQLAKLRDELPATEDGEVRVLIIHHSLMTVSPDGNTAQPPPKRFFPPALEITDHSRKALERFLVDFDIRIMLCGHLHVPRFAMIRASNGTETSEVLEARCGTTTQRDNYPYELNIDSTRKLAPNTLVLHKIVQRYRSFFWRSEVYWRNKSGRFVSTSNNNSLMPRDFRKEIPLASN